MKQEITRLTQRNQELEKKVFAGGAGGSLAIERVKELEMQLKAARSRALAVMDGGERKQEYEVIFSSVCIFQSDCFNFF